MIGKIIKETKVKTLGTWAWKCRKCNQEHSYQDKRCICGGAE